MRSTIHPGNLLFRLRRIDSLSIGEVDRRYGERQITKRERNDGAPWGLEVPL